MKTLCIVPCGNKKIWDKDSNAGHTMAKDVYIGPFAKKCQEYAEIYHSTSWCILSAKHGFLFPDDKIPGPYNVSFNSKKTSPIDLKELLIQAKRKQLYKYESIVVLGGKNYVEIAKKVFNLSKIHSPLSGCKGIGYMMQRINEAILSNKHL